MNSKQIMSVVLLCGGGVMLGVAGSATSQVAFGAGEFTAAGGLWTSLGGLAGIGSLITGAITFIKSVSGKVLDPKQQEVVNGGLGLLSTLLGGKMDAVGITVHAALAVLFANRAIAKDNVGLAKVSELATICLEQPKVAP